MIPDRVIRSFREKFGSAPPSLWMTSTAVAALAVSLVDAVLLHRKRGMFTGGFLAVEHLDSLFERVTFAATSLFSDAGLAGLLAAAALRAARVFGLRTPAAAVLAVSAAATPFVIADAIAYELIAFLGDSFDLGLMFDLTGRSAREVLAVSSAHLVMPIALIAAALSITTVGVVCANRSLPGPRWSGVVAILPPAALLVLAFSVHAFARTNSDVLDDALRRKPSGKVFGALAEYLTDFDRDGYGILRQPRDPNWFDAAIYPYAIDWPGNGIDEDGLLGDLPAGGRAYSEEPGAAPSFRRRPDVVLVVLESFRADVVGSTLNGRPITPTLDTLARGGVAASRAYSHNGYTTRSRRHLFSGSLAYLRGQQTLLDDFKANGYEVAYFSGQDESFGGEELSIHPERAEVFYDARQDRAHRYSTYASPGSLAVPADVVLERAGAFLSRRNNDRPLFLYVNFHDTHFPYWHHRIKPLVDPIVLPPSSIVPERAAELRRMYMNTAASVDASIAALLASVRKALGREPAIIVTADHGESLFDEGFLGHGYALNDAQTRVPLIVSGLPIGIAEPFGQSSLRSALWAALATENPPSGPTRRASASGTVFQYLGSLERPRQIALTREDGQDLYDFRETRANVRGSGWKHPTALTPTESAALVDLVRFWEQLRLAQARSNAAR